MKYRNLGNSGLKVSRIALGSWLTLGNTMDQGACTVLVEKAFAHGINLFDTADVYKRGKKKDAEHGVAEVALGKAIRDLPRHHVVIATKCFFPLSEDVNDRGLSRKHVLESCDASLRRLGTDYIDLYQCHRYDPETPLLETARAMDHLVRQGKVLYWGTSSWTAAQITEVAALCERHGLYAPISNQPVYNLFERGIEAEIVPASQKVGVGQIVYSPLAQGVLTGKYVPGEEPPKDSRAGDDRVNKLVGQYMTPERLELAQKLVALGARVGLSAANLALAFCLANDNIAAVIVGARDKNQLREHFKIGDLDVDAAVLDEVRALFPA
ncbi:MAG: aldo/keto reductase family protein [Planctomycetota bacterium]